MRSRAVVVLLGLCIAGVAAVAIVAATDDRTLAFTTDTRVVEPIVGVRAGQEACQRGLEAPAAFDVVELYPSTGPAPGPPLAVSVRRAGSAQVLATGRVAGGMRDDQLVRARVAPEVPEGSVVDVCFRDTGTRGVAFYGGPWFEGPGQSSVGTRPGRGDISLVFRRSEPRTVLSLVPDMFERASVFRPDPVGTWTFWVLLIAVAAGVPGLLALALTRATREDVGQGRRT
jgi:hypothetical protein